MRCVLENLFYDIQLRVLPGALVCVCVGDPCTEVLWVLSPHRATTQFAMKSKHFVSCLFCSESKHFVAISKMISHKFKYQIDYLHWVFISREREVFLNRQYTETSSASWGSKIQGIPNTIYCSFTFICHWTHPTRYSVNYNGNFTPLWVQKYIWNSFSVVKVPVLLFRVVIFTDK